MKKDIDVSIIIPCKNEGENLSRTLNSMLTSKNSLTFEIIVVDDGSNDDCTKFLEFPCNIDTYKDIKLIRTNSIGPARARNAGVAVSSGIYLFFCDGHVDVPDCWLDDLVNSLISSGSQIIAPCILSMSSPSVVVYGMIWDNQLNIKWLYNTPKDITEIPMACGCTFAIERKIFEMIHGFDSIFDGYGVEDQEICLKAWLFGYKVIIDPKVKVKHLFRSNHPYPIIQTDGVYNLICLAYYHFKLERLKKLMNQISGYSIYFDVIHRIKTNSDLILSQRNKYFNERRFNDDFFFEKFNIPF